MNFDVNIESRVNKGITLFDRVIGRKNWIKRFTPEILADTRVFSITRCPACMATGLEFSDAVIYLGITNRDTSKFGFNAEDEYVIEEFEILTECWRRRILQLKIRSRDQIKLHLLIGLQFTNTS